MEARGGATAGQTGQGSGRRLRVTWVKSAIGYRESQRLTIKSLGLRRLNQSVEHYDTPSIRGMLTKVHHLVRVDELPADAPEQPRGESGSERFQRRLRKKAAAYEAFAAAMSADAESAGSPEPASPPAASRSTAAAAGGLLSATGAAALATAGSPSDSTDEAAASPGGTVPAGAPDGLGAAGRVGADEVTEPASQPTGTESAVSRLLGVARERSGAAGLAAAGGAAAVTAAAGLADPTGEATAPLDQPGPADVSGTSEATGSVDMAEAAAPTPQPAAAAPADLTGAPGGEDPVASVGGATEAGATAEGGNSLRERIGDVIDTVQERAGDAVDTAQQVVGGVVGIAVDRAQEVAGRGIDTAQERLELEGSGPRSNDAVEAEAEDAAGSRREDESSD